MDLWIDLLTTCIHHSEIHFTDHWHTHRLVFSVYYILHESFSGNGFYRGIFFSLPHSSPLVTAACAELLSTSNPTNLTSGWWPFHTNPIDFSSQADFQLTTEVSHSPPSYFSSLHSTELPTTVTAARLVSSLYNLRADATENTASNIPSIVVMGGCLAVDWLSFPTEHIYRPLFVDGCFVYPSVALQRLYSSVSRSLPSNGSMRHSILPISH
jgi:hypothetical protein